METLMVIIDRDMDVEVVIVTVKIGEKNIREQYSYNPETTDNEIREMVISDLIQKGYEFVVQ